MAEEMANGGRNLENERDHYFHYPQWTYSHVRDRRAQTLLARLRIGHTYLTQWYLLTRNPQPFCYDCLVPLTVLGPECLAQGHDVFGFLGEGGLLPKL
ncbi:hypothetical protein E2C01_030932 [Portunus trituberculatus]|uniref:Uncharacterized protein n=1 Tax=Portunus trituberculatus TaxID=210409 RepID=A0A5B7ESB9_PORTR|nr:hypothetical protein [Portunus trituberculatus]